MAGRGAHFNKVGFILKSTLSAVFRGVRIRAIFGQQIALEGDAQAELVCLEWPYSCQVAVMGPTFASDDGGTGNPYFLSESLSRSARRKSRLDR